MVYLHERHQHMLTLTWDTERIFGVCGGDAGVIAVCARAEPLTVPPRPGTVAVWRHRKRIPSEWLPALVLACIEQDIETSTLIRRETPEPASEPASALSLDDVGL
jgi:hypothetical protein